MAAHGPCVRLCGQAILGEAGTSARPVAGFANAGKTVRWGDTYLADVVSVYSSGAIGRLVPEDVIGLVRYLREHSPAATA